VGQDRETHGQRQSTIAQHGDLLDSDTRLDSALGDPRGRPCRYADGILVRSNMMTWYAAIYCTQVDPDTIMVCCAAPWFSFTCGDCGPLCGQSESDSAPPTTKV
jgi:hypothetical protein